VHAFALSQTLKAENLKLRSAQAFSFEHSTGGGERARTDDPQRAKLVLSQLSYTPQKAFGFTYSP
jgi:hypothetical protein